MLADDGVGSLIVLLDVECLQIAVLDLGPLVHRHHAWLASVLKGIVESELEIQQLFLLGRLFEC